MCGVQQMVKRGTWKQNQLHGWAGEDMPVWYSMVYFNDAWLNLQSGMEFEYYFSNRYFGGVFSAVNVCAYQSNAFAPNISTTLGYIFPQDRGKRRIRIGLNYYNGRALSNQFQNQKEKFIAFIVALDV